MLILKYEINLVANFTNTLNIHLQTFLLIFSLVNVSFNTFKKQKSATKR